MHFTRLKLSGFKSFVDPTELLIETGLTGVVGPNGCGKSNLVEALRWVMGESSAKQMRGGEMDDVIFAGTAMRPARNLAEVALVLDNTVRDAPAAFNDAAEIEISRRIERGAGSTYRINGREMRARDVQLLFADASSGARSTALVSQGQVGALIGAKPAERRHLIEEAAGITGLHSRRHEAELRLRAAEANLERLDDVIATLDSQMQSLRRQARQAARYRSLSARVRKAEAALSCRRLADAEAALAEAEAGLRVADSVVTEATRVAARAAAAQGEAAARLPGLREGEAKVAAALHRLEVAREQLDQEEARLTEAMRDASRQLDDLGADAGRERNLLAEAEAGVRRLAEEAEGLRAGAADHERRQGEAARALEEARARLAEAEAEAARLTEQVAAELARREGLERRRTELADRLAAIDARRGAAADESARLEARLADDADLAAAEAGLAQAREAAAARHGALERAHQALTEAERARAAAEAAERAARTALSEAEVARERAGSEARTLADLLARRPSDLPPVVDRIEAAPGLELALGAALGDDLLASTDSAAPAHWRELGHGEAGPPLPQGAEPLAANLSAPAALGPRLAQVGLVARADGARLQARLAQGQRLVSREGDLWRWDGYVASAESGGGAVGRLRQRRRLEELEGGRAALESRHGEAARAAQAAAEARERALAAYEHARDEETRARADARAADAALEQALEARARAADALAEARSRLAALRDARARLDADRADVERAGADTEAAFAALPAPESARAPLDAARARLAERRAEAEARLRDHEGLVREAEARAHRLEAIAGESEAWQKRAGSAAEQIAALDARMRTLEDRLAALREEPARLARQRQGLQDQIESTAAERSRAADALAEAETRLAEADRGLRDANEALARAREERVRAEGRRDQARSLAEVAAAQIRERFDCAPDQALALAEADDAAALGALDALERQVERLHRERDNMGAVNLRADEEAAELGEQIDTMRTERDDLVSAIAKLRGGIASLNREGRQRLLAAFEEVNAHFQSLFQRLFGGGRAHLELAGDDDPLEAGLEVMASPPGKRLQALSLLSGGEKALAGLALLFAVFLTRPAPICVLDEVDAPLDDANVDRFCTLLEDIAAEARTRFVVITHHRMTMARMNRLFGITMGERGVSQLVSVDMDNAVQLQAAE